MTEIYLSWYYLEFASNNAHFPEYIEQKFIDPNWEPFRKFIAVIFRPRWETIYIMEFI